MYAESSAKSSKPGTSASHGIDTQLSAVETAQSKAWNAHITTHLGDLVVRKTLSMLECRTKLLILAVI